MYKRTMTAITLAMWAALVALPAQAKTEVLLIGAPRLGDTMAELRASLKNDFGVDDILVATAGNPHEIADRVRAFLGAKGKPDEFRVVWVPGNASDICPGFDEAPVRPQTRSLVVAPSCLKLVIQAPTTYERLGAENHDDRSGVDPRAPAVAFVSSTDSKPSEILTKPIGTLAQTLACSRSGYAALDFSPSVVAWGVSGNGCQIAPLSPHSVEAVPATRTAAAPPERAPEKSVADPLSTVPANQFKLVAPAKGRVVSAYGSQLAGKPNKGIDIEVPAGTVATAAESGEVVFVGELPGYGLVVAIKHDNDWATIYARTARLRVTQGQKVTKGQDLGDVDPDARRLHFEVRRKGKPIDPETLIAVPG